ncbi:response regulator [Altererythrobacter aerius]|uniref:Response regulator n=1 Tax=Tsuneonella aeria TaxID=1837929 RepID=A0A6I4TDV0_9SPHN|nr:response regulator [Tsuneonella aeria]MXO75759.1 response regulator [Tsuneonella aeria]
MTALPLILIADDEPLLTELLEFRLGARGYRTAIAQDGRETLAKLEELKPDAVVLDMMMPVYDGSEVLRRMRTSAEHASTPVIMLSARRGEADVVSALEQGADDYLVKPFLPEELLIRLSKLLAGRRA